MNPAFLKYKLHFIFLNNCSKSSCVFGWALLKAFPFHWDSGQAFFSQVEMHGCKHLTTLCYINYRLHLQTTQGDKTRTFKPTSSQRGVSASSGYIFKEAQGSVQKTSCINHCRMGRGQYHRSSHVQGARWVLKERQKAFREGLTSPSLPRTTPVLATVVTQSGLCGYTVSKGLEN